MPLIHDATESVALASVPAAIRTSVRAEISRQFWIWYAEHANDVVISRRIAFWRVDVQVHELRSLFVLIFGGGGP